MKCNRPSFRIRGGALAIALFALTTTPQLSATVLPANGTSEDSPRLGDGYDSVFKVKKYGCVAGTQDEDVNQSISSELEFASNMTLDSIVNSLEVGPEFRLNKYFFNLRANAQFMNAHSAGETSSTFHFFWRGTGKTKSLNHSSGLQPDIPDLSNISHLDGEDLDDIAKLVHLRSACGDEFISEIRYGAYLIVTLKINFATKEDKNRFDAEIQGGIGKQASSNASLPSTSKGSRVNTEQAENLSATIGGKILDLERGHDLRSSSVEVIVNQVGGDPTAMRAILGSKAISGKLITECTGTNDLQKCVHGFSEAVQYTNSFLESLSSGKNNLWSPMVYITRPYISVSNLLSSPLFELAEDEVVAEEVETEIEQLDRFLDYAKKIEFKASELLDSLNNGTYKVDQEVKDVISEILHKSQQVHTDIATAVYSTCTRKITKCPSKIDDFKEKYSFPYELDIDERYLDLRMSTGGITELDPVAGSEDGGRPFTHIEQTNNPSGRTVTKIFLQGGTRPKYLALTLDDETELTVGRKPSGEGENSSVYIDSWFGIPAVGNYDHFSSQVISLDSEDFISHIEAHTGTVDGSGRVVYLKICKSDSHFEPQQLCIETGTPSPDLQSRAEYTVEKDEKIIGFHGKQGAEIDLLGLIVAKKIGLVPAP